MAPYIEYVVKVSIAIMVISVFYHFVLRKYTFFNWNRWYLLGYSLLTFFIPFINIDPALKQVNLSDHEMVKVIPAIQGFAVLQVHSQPVPVKEIPGSGSDVITTILLVGGLIMIVRVILALFSYYKLRSKAQLISDGEVKVFQVEKISHRSRLVTLFFSTETCMTTVILKKLCCTNLSM
jgi:hypothetical protein